MRSFLVACTRATKHTASPGPPRTAASASTSASTSASAAPKTLTAVEAAGLAHISARRPTASSTIAAQCSWYSSQSPDHQLVDRALKDLLAADKQRVPAHTSDARSSNHRLESKPAVHTKEVGRRRPKKLSTGRNGEPRTTQSKLLIRQKLLARLESEYPSDVWDLEKLQAENESRSPAQRHILVREFVSILRRFNDTGFVTVSNQSEVDCLAEGGDIGDGVDEKALVEAAWDQYVKITRHANAAQIMPQIPLPSLSLLICELNFMANSTEYRTRFARIISVFNGFAHIGHPITTPLLFSMYLRALNKQGNYQAVLREVNEYKGHLTGNILRQVISAHFGCRRPDLAMQLLESMRNDPVHKSYITPHVYSSIIGGALRANALSHTELSALLKEMLDQLSDSAYHDSARTGLLNELMHLTNKLGNLDFMYELFEQFLSRSMPINYTTFAILIHCACNLEKTPLNIYRAYQMIITNELAYERLNHRMFAVFINSFVRNDRIDFALAALQDLRAHPTAQMTIQHYNHLFAYFATNGLAAQALDLYREVAYKDKLALSWPICVDIIKAIERDSHYLQHTMDPLEPEDVVDSDSEGALLTAVIAHGLANRSLQMFDTFFELRKRYPESILPFVAVLIPAREFAKSSTKRTRQGAQPYIPQPLEYDGSHCEVTEIESLGYYEFVERLHLVRDSLIEASATIKVPRNMYNMAISVFAMIRDHESTQILYDHMTGAEGMEPDMRTFNVLLQAFAKSSDMDATKEILKDIEYNKMHLNRASANAVINAALLADQPQQAISIYAHMVSRPVPLSEHAVFTDFIPNAPVDVFTVALLVKGLVQSRMLKEAIVVFEDSFTLLPFVPRQLLETLLGTLEEEGHGDFAQLCSKRYSKRVESSQPTEMTSGQGVNATERSDAPDRLPLSYFGYLLQPGAGSEDI
ncbi:hypothetical protein GGI07_003698 [Coemansia sp. Benny D115]|nr:hypothetical protein GGI07_003698 [Coemansia sp. Benny D115]